jgi:DNA-directed primase/polymerase protein
MSSKSKSLLQSVAQASLRKQTKLLDRTSKRPRVVTNAEDHANDAIPARHVDHNTTDMENFDPDEPKTVPPTNDSTTAAMTIESNTPVSKPSPHKLVVKSRSFYSPAALRLKHVEERVLRFLAQVRQRAQGHATCLTWRQFPTQQQAFDFADAEDPTGERLRIFSFELSSSGTRKFLVASYVEFWRRYSSTILPHHRHYYEIIREGWPCHVYFDIEFDRLANPHLDGEAAVDAVLSLLRTVGSARALPGCGPSKREGELTVVELDSSTPTKFSRHLIVRLPGAAFATNAHAGAIVRKICALAWENRVTDPRCQALVAKKSCRKSNLAGAGVSQGSTSGDDATCQRKDGKNVTTNTATTSILLPSSGSSAPMDDIETLVIDGGVYTRNRAFRLYMSSKAGKEAVLQSTGRFGTDAWAPEQIFMASLVGNVDPSARLVRLFDESKESGEAATARARAAAAAGHRHGRLLISSGIGQHPCYGPSAFPELDAFIESVCSARGGRPGSIRSWVVLDPGDTILYNIKGNRWCGNVEREHRSNGVFYVVDMQQGLWFQKCYDPDCRNWRSPVNSLPRNVADKTVGCRQSLPMRPHQNEVDASVQVEDELVKTVAAESGTVWGSAEECAAWEEAAIAAAEEIECRLGSCL